MADFEKMYKQFEKKYNRYIFQCTLEPFEAFLRALHEKAISRETYAEARAYFGKRWNDAYRVK